MDGEWRNVEKDGNVISYRALSPEEFAEALNIFPGWMREGSRSDWREWT
jgi:hypothetical protein